MKNNNAFTMLEMMMVLGVVVVISFITINVANGFRDNYEVQIAIDTFGSDYNTMQTYAIVNGVSCYIDINESSYSVYYDNTLIETVTFSDVTMSSNFSDGKVKVNEYGNITQAGTITFNNGEKLVFTIGVGRYEQQ